MTELLKTPLHNLHMGLGARMVPFAGYEMALQFPTGILKEHLHTRAAAGLFDVSHMGQVAIRSKSGEIADAAEAMERLMPMDVAGLAEGRQRYGLLTNERGGIRDDVMFANRGDHFLMVVNAANRADDLAYLDAEIGETCTVELLERGLLALQGPKAEAALARLHPDVATMRFMDVWALDVHGLQVVISRSGYTGEDGYEISLRAQDTMDFARWLLDLDGVAPIGLGARDLLRLEAGLCLHGHDIDSGTTPVEAGLAWSIQKVRRAGGARAGGFPGDDVILRQLEKGAERRRVGLRPEGRAPMREGTELFAEADGEAIGTITSGGFGPSLDAPVAMGYVPVGKAEPGTRLLGRVRGQMMPVEVAKMPMVVPGYRRD